MTPVQIGLETLLREMRPEVTGQRLGLIVGAASVDHQLNSSVARLWNQDGVRLTALYGAEHGLRGEAQAGEHVNTYQDSVTGLPVHSLYGKTVRPLPEMLSDVDTLLYDLQDGGLRFYTFLSTLFVVMQACAEHGKRLLVLDRPAPLNGVTLEGAVLRREFASFVGIAPVPARYAMTAGEIALMLNAREGIGCDVTVIPMRGWTRGLWHDGTGMPFVPPSPNIPTLNTLTAYAGTCLIEGTNLSEGRGTTKPFEYIGAPYVDALALTDALNAQGLEGVRFRPVYYVPTFSKYAGELCAGVHLVITDRAAFQPTRAALHIIAAARALYPHQLAWREPWAAGSLPPIELLSGGDTLRAHIDAGGSADSLWRTWQEESAAFAESRAPYLLYDE